MRYAVAVLAVFLAAAFVGAGEKASAATQVSDAGKLKVALAGRQRMLTQRMAKAVCLDRIAPGYGAAHQVRTALQQFEGALHTLENGDPARGLEQEFNPTILAHLAATRDSFLYLRQAVQSALSDRTRPLDDVAASSMSTLAAAHAATGVIARFSRNQKVHPAKSSSVNMAGRQRMLTQKMAKEVCLIAAGHDPDVMRRTLGETLNLFTTSMSDLVDGNYASRIPSAPPEIAVALRSFEYDFEPTADRISAIVGGAALDDATALDLAQSLDRSLLQMQKLVEMY